MSTMMSREVWYSGMFRRLSESIWAPGYIPEWLNFWGTESRLPIFSTGSEPISMLLSSCSSRKQIAELTTRRSSGTKFSSRCKHTRRPPSSSSAIALRPHRTFTSKDSSSIQDVGQNISLVSCNNLYYTIVIDALITSGSQIYFARLQGTTMSTALEYSDASVCSLAVEFSTKSTVQ